MNWLPVLFVVGIVAGWIDSIAGGGGLITIPVLLHYGLPPADALRTNTLPAGLRRGAATFNLTKATAHTKLMNFTSNAASLAMFIAGEKTHWDAGLVMGLGQLFGARLGAKMVVARGARFIRPIFIAIVLTISVRLLVTAIHH